MIWKISFSTHSFRHTTHTRFRMHTIQFHSSLSLGCQNFNLFDFSFSRSGFFDLYFTRFVFPFSWIDMHIWDLFYEFLWFLRMNCWNEKSMLLRVCQRRHLKHTQLAVHRSFLFTSQFFLLLFWFYTFNALTHDIFLSRQKKTAYKHESYTLCIFLYFPFHLIFVAHNFTINFRFWKINFHKKGRRKFSIQSKILSYHYYRWSRRRKNKSMEYSHRIVLSHFHNPIKWISEFFVGFSQKPLN